MSKEVTVRGIIIKDNQVILMYRRKNGVEYYAIPGGHLENNESNEECLIREIKEEFSIDVKVIKLLGKVEKNNKIDYIYSCEWIDGELLLGGEEKIISNSENYYEIRKVNIKDIDKIELYKENLDMIKKVINERTI